jgi:hypothetical protein
MIEIGKLLQVDETDSRDGRGRIEGDAALCCVAAKENAVPHAYELSTMSYISMAVATSWTPAQSPKLFEVAWLHHLLIHQPLWRASNLLVILLLLGLESGHGDTVQITLAGLGDAAATLVLIDLKDTDLLKRLADLAVDGAGGVNVTAGAGTAVLGGTVDLAKTADTDSLAHVDVAGNGSSADVVPVNVLGRKLLGGTGLDGVDPTLISNNG